MKIFPEYKARAQAMMDRDAHRSDWQGLSLSEASRLAITLVNLPERDRDDPIIKRDHLEKFAESIEERFPPLIYRSWW